MESNRDPLELATPAAAEISDTVAPRERVEEDAQTDAPAAGDALATQSPDAAADELELAAEEPQPDAPTEAAAPDAVDTLSPAVRRLVRQYDLDITGIHGTGPSGRIRVGDVIGMLGRADGAPRPGDARGANPDGDDTIVEARLPRTPLRSAAPGRAPAPSAAAVFAAPATTVYECDLSRVLSHRKHQRRSNVEVLLTSYYLVACGEALKAVPEVVAGSDGADARFGVLLAGTEGDVRTTLVDAVDTVDDSAFGSIDDRLRSFDQALRAIGDSDLADASLLIHHYGLSGSLLATPTPLGAGHVASVGLGRVRREIVVKSTDGDEAPRVAAMCYVTLTFLPDRLPLHRANRFTAHLVRVLEQWPD